MKIPNRSAVLFALLVPLASASNAAIGLDVAIIVNPANPTTSISSRELEKILKQDKQNWEDGKKILLVLQETGTAEKEVVLSKVYKMQEAELKKFWLSKMFRGEIASFPKTLSSSGSVSQFVGKVPNAIGFVDASLVSGVKVVKVDGKLPGEAGYPLASK